MPVLLRVLLWLACTSLTVTAVFLAVGFVVESTAPVPALALPTPALFGPSGTVDGQPSPDATSGTAVSASPKATPTPGAGHSALTPSPRPSASPTGQHPVTGSSCQGGAGTHTVRSAGGQASISFGSGAVCLVSAVPAAGFSTDVSQPDPGTLVVTFTSSGHRSTITATLSPQPRAAVRETAL